MVCMRRPGPIVAAIVVALGTVPTAHAAEPEATPVQTLTLFGSLAEARHHCPEDRVIKIVLPDGFYLHGDRGFGGSSLNQVFVCSSEAASIFATRKPAKQ